MTEYLRCVHRLGLIPEGASLAALEMDYAAMLEDGLLARDQPEFSAMMEKCSAIQERMALQPQRVTAGNPFGGQ